MTQSEGPSDNRILKTCTFCGVQTVGDAPACARCGRPFLIPRTSGENKEGTRPGESSPAKQPGAYCMRCGAFNPATNQFCGHCGAPLQTAASRNNDAAVPAMPEGTPQKAPRRSSTLGLIICSAAVVTGVLVMVGRNVDNSNKSVSLVNSQTFVCPTTGCEVATDSSAMMVLVLHQTDTPGDNGFFDSSARTEAYSKVVAEGKIITIPAGIHAERLYQTPVDSKTSARYSVVKILDGDYSGRRVIVQDQHLQ